MSQQSQPSGWEMEPTTIRERKHRLPSDAYDGKITIAFTLCVHNRTTLFLDGSVVSEFERILVSEAVRFECDLLIYLFMRDHLHTLVQGTSEEARPLRMVRMFKQKSGYWLSKNRPQVEWQKGFYDHILRNEKEVPRQIEYILSNPVKKEIVPDWRDYGFKGSTVFDLDEWCPPGQGCLDV